MESQIKRNMEGLIRVLYEQAEPFHGTDECCDKESGQFLSNNEDGPTEWGDLRIYRTRTNLINDQALMVDEDIDNFDVLSGDTIDEFYDKLTTPVDKCKLYNLLVQIDEDNELLELPKQSLRDKIKELCPETKVSETEVVSDLCTPADDNGKTWYKFSYGTKLSPQVRNEFRYEILKKLRGGTIFAPGEEKLCIENLKVWYEAPDQHITSPAYTQFAAPKIDWWDGFKIDCDCVIESSPYKTKNLKIEELESFKAYNKPLVVPKSESSSSSSSSTIKTVEPGLKTVISTDPVEVETSYDIDFL